MFAWVVDVPSVGGSALMPGHSESSTICSDPRINREVTKRRPQGADESFYEMLSTNLYKHGHNLFPFLRPLLCTTVLVWLHDQQIHGMRS